jgi:hypothetical protein
VTQGHIILDLLNWGVNAAFLVPFLFPLVIRTIWAWEKDEWGWNIICLDLCVASALLPSFVHKMFQVNIATYFFGWFQVASIWLVPVIIIWRALLIFQKQRGNE